MILAAFGSDQGKIETVHWHKREQRRKGKSRVTCVKESNKNGGKIENLDFETTQNS